MGVRLWQVSYDGDLDLVVDVLLAEAFSPAFEYPTPSGRVLEQEGHMGRYRVTYLEVTAPSPYGLVPSMNVNDGAHAHASVIFDLECLVTGIGAFSPIPDITGQGDPRKLNALITKRVRATHNVLPVGQAANIPRCHATITVRSSGDHCNPLLNGVVSVKAFQ